MPAPADAGPFRRLADNGSLVPFTFADFEARDKELHVQAFHAFPADYTILSDAVHHRGRDQAPAQDPAPAAFDPVASRRPWKIRSSGRIGLTGSPVLLYTE